jgi:glycosyltransferase involved in cell wall biosynthesis
MRVLLATQYFPPEITAASGRLHAFAAGLAARGHEVEVICEVPNHPEGVVAPGYGGKLVDRRAMDGFEVSYVWVRTTPSKEPRARMVNYASYAVSATLAGARRRRPDVVVASSPPLPVGSVGAALARRHRVPWVLDVRDLWPDVAVVVDQVSEGRLLRAAERLERRLYRSAAAITATTDAFAREIDARGGAGKVTLIRNGASAAALEAGAREPEPSLLGGDGDRPFTWTYAGNVGLAQGLEAAVEAARRLGEGFRLLIVGEGPRRPELRRLAEDLPDGAVEFRDPVPAAEAVRIMRASDALLVSLAATPGLEGFVPSKLFDCCAVGRPVILAAAGEAREIAEGAEAALTVDPGDPGQLAEAVKGLREDEARREALSERARSFAEENSRERGTELLESVLLEVTGAAAQRRSASSDS